jgi:hypothetical protein
MDEINGNTILPLKLNASLATVGDKNHRCTVVIHGVELVFFTFIFILICFFFKKSLRTELDPPFDWNQYVPNVAIYLIEQQYN